MELLEKKGELILAQISIEGLIATCKEFKRLNLDRLETFNYIGISDFEPIRSIFDKNLVKSRFHAHLSMLESEESSQIVLNAIRKLADASDVAMEKLGYGVQKTAAGFFKKTNESDYLVIEGITKLEAKILHALLYSSEE